MSPELRNYRRQCVAEQMKGIDAMGEIQKPLMNIAEAVEKARKAIAELPDVLDCALIGSARYIEKPNDVDFAVLIPEEDSVTDYTGMREKEGWGKCGNYDTESPGTETIWAAIRREEVNFMITNDRGFFERYKTAMEVCVALNLQTKRERIMVCKIVRDGMTAKDALAWKATFDDLGLDAC